MGSFLGDEYFGSKRDDTMKVKMKATVKEVIENSANAKAAVGLISDASGKTIVRKHKGGGVANAWKQLSSVGSSFPPRFEKAMGGPGGQLPTTVFVKRHEKGQMAKATARTSRCLYRRTLDRGEVPLWA